MNAFTPHEFRMKRMLFLWVCLWVSLGSFAQKYPFRNYRIEDGLAKSDVYDILQDSRGYMWFCTGGGVSRFDGRNFHNFTIRDGLPSNVVYCIVEDKRGYLWFGTDAGVCRYNPYFNISKNDKQIFLTITTSDGLVWDKVSCLFIDKKNNLWIGTSLGINILTLEAFNTDEISHPQIRKTIKNIFISESKGRNGILDFKEDSKGNIWIGTYYEGLFIYPAKSHLDVKNFLHLSRTNGLNSDKIYSIHFWKNYSMLATDKGLNVLSSDIKNYKTQELNPVKYITSAEGLADNNIRIIYEDSSAGVWLGTQNGLSKIHFADDNMAYFTINNYKKKNGLLNDNIWSLHGDNENNLWVGTFGGGVFKLPPFPFHNYNTESGLKNNMVLSIYLDKNENVYIGSDYSGLSEFYKDSISGTLILKNHYDVQNAKLNNNIVYSVIKDSLGRIWAGTYGGGINIISNLENKPAIYLDQKNNYPNRIFSLLRDSKNRIWAGSNGGGLMLFDPLEQTTANVFSFKRYAHDNNSLVNSNVHSLFEDSEKNIWIGTYKGLCVYFNIPNRIHEPVFYHITLKDGLPNDHIWSFAEDNYGNIWVGTYGSGIAILNKSEIRKMKEVVKQKLGINYNKIREYVNDLKINWKYISSSEGLLDDAVVSLLFIPGKKNILIGTNKGLTSIYTKDLNSGEYKCRNYTKEDGFEGVECNMNAMKFDGRDKVYIGTIGGMTVYDPFAEKINTVQPVLKLDPIKIFQKKVDWKKFSDTLNPLTGFPPQMNLPYNANHITFNFIGIGFTVPEKIKYQYKLDGFDKDWSPVSMIPTATYTNLEPGKYEFIFRACNNDFIWNKIPYSIKFKISPPYWNTWWFYTLEFLFFALLIITSFIFGHYKQNTKVATILVFISIFVVFEFMKTLLEPYFDLFIGGIPLFKVIINLILASVLFPVERILKKYLEG